MEYLPDHITNKTLNFHDRHFIWTVIFNTHKAWGDKYFKEVMDYHYSKPKIAPTEKMITVTDDWLKKLKEFDYMTKNKNPKINIFLQKKNAKVKPKVSKKRTKFEFSLSQAVDELEFSECSDHGYGDGDEDKN
jgi:hypothetical protein